jgi:UDP-glucose 4-epimerase
VELRRITNRAIIHFAASVAVPESVAEPLRYYRNNTLAKFDSPEEDAKFRTVSKDVSICSVACSAAKRLF